MEVDQIQYKLQRSTNGNGIIASAKMSQNQKMDYHYPDEEEEGKHKRGASDAAAYGGGGGIGRFYGLPSSRIVRVSRASGGKDRHSKVLTSKGLRDRRVRLSVNTAIQFYDLQDRLGYDQPSKAVEWLLKAAASSIEELPPMNPPFPDTPKQMSDEKRSSTTAGSDGAAADPSSTSETSKGSSRSETRVKARERAKGRVAEKEKEKENESSHNPSSFHPINRTSSFTELLNGGINSTITNGRQWSSPPMDYFTNGYSPPLAATGGGHSSELHHFSFGPDNYGSNNGSGEYNLNFSISSANSAGVFAGYNRGTLQSNSSSSPSLLRFSPPDGSHQNFFMGAAAAPEAENHGHHQFLSGFYNQKGKGKN